MEGGVGEIGARTAVVHRIVASETGDIADLGATLAAARGHTAVEGIVVIDIVGVMMIEGGMMTTGAGAHLAVIAGVEADLVSEKILPAAG